MLKHPEDLRGPSDDLDSARTLPISVERGGALRRLRRTATAPQRTRDSSGHARTSAPNETLWSYNTWVACCKITGAHLRAGRLRCVGANPDRAYGVKPGDACPEELYH